MGDSWLSPIFYNCFFLSQLFCIQTLPERIHNLVAGRKKKQAQEKISQTMRQIKLKTQRIGSQIGLQGKRVDKHQPVAEVGNPTK